MRRRLISLVVVLLLAWGGLATTLAAGITPKLGLDLQGGTSVVLTAPPDTEQDVLEVAVEIMRARIEEVGGVQEPEIAISGGNTVLVQLPGVTDRERALEAVGQTGQLSFRPVLEASFGPVSPLITSPPTTTTTTEPGGTTTTTTTTTTGAGGATTTTAVTTTTTTLPEGVGPDTGLTIEDDPDREAWLPLVDADGQVVQVFHVGPAALLGSDVAQALAGFDPNQGQWLVNLDLTSQGSGLFAEMTREAAGFPLGDPRRQIAIVLDGEVITAPPVAITVDPSEGITGGSAQITIGSSPGSEEEARDLGVVLRYGALPVSFERSQVQNVSATLGADSLRVGLMAGFAGLLLVAALLLVSYRAMGLVAIVGLTVFGSLLVLIFSLLGRLQGLTLTLAGVTGIVVSVGITADSYIVFFERVKEELRGGRTVRSASEEGFRAAYRTILTADTVSLLGAGLLWWLAVGPVKGFALALGIATLLDLVVARFYTRHAVAMLATSRFGDGGTLSIRGASGLTREATT
ncbi:MAG: protein translocase subunit SecD [Acidimicrobiia bacterium]